jgi:N utilization substance protein B
MNSPENRPLEFTGLDSAEIKQLRRHAVQMMYQIERNSLVTMRDEIFEEFARQNDVASTLQPWLREFVALSIQNMVQFDSWIRSRSTNWSIDRMGRVDLAILRVCITELVLRQSVRPAIVIAEAAEIAKEFGTENSQPFVHGILDAVYKEFIRPTVSKESPPD